MNFSSLAFLFFFLPVFLILFFAFPKKHRYIIVLLGSLLFYFYSGLFNFLLISGISLFNYVYLLVIKKIKKHDIFLIILAILNIATLLFFKYNSLFAFPLGISFYTFNNLTYIFDIKKKVTKIETNILYYFTYVFLFCHVTMGPIVKYEDISKQIKNLNPTFDEISNGFKRFLRGLIKKVLVANNLGLLYASLFSHANTSSLLNIFCLIVFGLQLYIDFSSYCDMAIGLGKMLGINYPENFDYPYLAKSVSEFWRRWHMTLTNFFKEYVYIPLKGNRVPLYRCIINILIVWFLTGIWHGNTLNFLLWGLYYGLILIIEKYLISGLLKKMPDFLKHIYVIGIVFFGYVFFSINDFSVMISFIKGLFTAPLINNYVIFYLKENIVLLFISLVLCFKVPSKITNYLNNHSYLYIIECIFYIVLFIVTISYIVSGTYQPFLYNAF